MIEPLNAVDWVRARPEQFFFGQTAPKAVHLLAYLMADVVTLGGGRCTIRRWDDWWTVGSDFDWMAGAPYDPVDLFCHVVVAPQQGIHSMRGEIVVAAFAADVTVVGRGESLKIKGESPNHDVLVGIGDDARAVAFRLVDAGVAS